jgi:thiol:disulfide interchange protein
MLDENGRKGRLSVTAEIAPGWHIYSVTQRSGGPQRTEIRLQPSRDFRLAGAFAPDKPPDVRQLEFFPVPVEEHRDQVTWTAPIELAEGVKPQGLRMAGRLGGQVCQESGVCIPLDGLDTSFVAEYAPASVAQDQPPQPLPLAAVGTPYRAPGSHTEISGYVSPRVGAAGGRATLVLIASPDPGWHVYALTEGGPKPLFSNPTVIGVRTPGGWTVGPPKASLTPTIKPSGLEAEPMVRYHEQPVSWSMDLEIPSDVAPGTYELTGIIGYQTCSEICDLPLGATFSVRLPVARQAASGQLPLTFAMASYQQAFDVAAGTSFRSSTATSTSTVTSTSADSSGAPGGQAGGRFAAMSVPAILGLAFLAGLILNVMPCVLPVLGLKIMSFVQQAGESRLRIFGLNLWFSLGLLTVFWLLATIPVGLNLVGREANGWGAQFTYAPFNITLAAVVFVFALSFLGVWEIPIPGFVGSSKAMVLGEREGFGGAFSKGVLATVLATPCTGPFLGSALSWAIVQPPWLTYALFTSIGLGMASPYLLIGMFPSLIGLLPKPGAWMETLKQLMGFVLMGTVVWILYFLDESYTVRTLSLLLALGLACWWIGRTPLTALRRQKVWAWMGATGIVTFVALAAFVEAHYVAPTLGMLLGGGLAVWLIGSTPSHAGLATRARRWGGAAVVTVLACLFAYFSLVSAELPWEPFTRASLDEYRSQQYTVLVDFTADW